MTERDDVVREVYESAYKNEMTYAGCSQTVLGALQEKFDEITPSVFRSGSALAAGVARHGESCGALVAAIMAVSAVAGRQRLENYDEYQEAMNLGMQVYEEFKKEIGHTICWEIHKIKYGRAYKLYLPEDREVFREIGCRSEQGCPVVCGTAAAIAARMILKLKGGSEST